MLSVVLPFRDAVHTLDEAIASVLADPACEELITVDDGSRDGGTAVAERWAMRDARVKLHRTEPSGVAKSLALGVELARGELIGRMDADDVSLPGRLSAARSLLARDETLAVVGTQVTVDSEAGDGLGRYVAWQNSLLDAADHLRDRFVEATLCHPSTVMRRACLAQAGGYVERSWPQDYDLWLRFHQLGFGIAKVPQVLLSWRHRPGRVTFTAPTSARDRLVDARAHYLAPVLRAQGQFAIWGAGKTGKRLARALEQHGLRPELFIDIDLRKIGGTARQRPVVDPREGLASGLFLVAAVGEPGAREQLRERLALFGRRDPETVLFAA